MQLIMIKENKSEKEDKSMGKHYKRKEYKKQ